MDKDVLIKFIDMIQSVLSRVNSKRLLTLYAFYYWLYSVMGVIGATWTASLGGWATFVVLYSFFVENQTKTPDTM
jgi:hypothetical protein